MAPLSLLLIYLFIMLGQTSAGFFHAAWWPAQTREGADTIQLPCKTPPTSPDIPFSFHYLDPTSFTGLSLRCLRICYWLAGLQHTHVTSVQLSSCQAEEARHIYISLPYLCAIVSTLGITDRQGFCCWDLYFRSAFPPSHLIKHYLITLLII